MGDYENQRNYRNQGQLVGSREQKKIMGDNKNQEEYQIKGDHENQRNHKIKGDQ